MPVNIKNRYWYAAYYRYGIGTSTTVRRNGREITVPCATLYRFSSLTARDEWVSDDVWDDGRYRKLAADRNKARQIEPDAFNRAARWPDCGDWRAYDIDNTPYPDGMECWQG